MSPSEIVSVLLTEYDVPSTQLEADVAATLTQLVTDNLIAYGCPTNGNGSTKDHRAAQVDTPAPNGTIRIPSVLRCTGLILLFKISLRYRGYSRTINWIRDKVAEVPPRPDTCDDEVKRTEYRVALAGALYPGRARCLEQSLTLYYLLRRQGVRVTYRQGVQPYPFQAHAWIEYRNQVVNDVPEHAAFYAPFPDQLP